MHLFFLLPCFAERLPEYIKFCIVPDWEYKEIQQVLVHLKVQRQLSLL